MSPDRMISNLCYKYYCSVPGCRSNSFSNSDLFFHKFPDPGPYAQVRSLPPQLAYVIVDKRGYQYTVDQLTVWKTVLKISELTKDMRVCSLHFKKDDYQSPDCPSKRPQLVKTAVPSCNLPESYPEPLQSTSWRVRSKAKLPTSVDIRALQKPFISGPESQILINGHDEEDPMMHDGGLNGEPAIELEVEFEQEETSESETEEVNVIFHDHDYFEGSPKFACNGWQEESNSATISTDCSSDQNSVDDNADDHLITPTSSSVTNFGIQNTSAQNVPASVFERYSRVKKQKSVPTQTEEKFLSISYNYIERKAGLAYYTGLDNSKVFRFILKSLGPAAYHLQNQWHRVDKISVENQLLITLMKLKRYTPSVELATMFDTHSTAVHNIFLTWVNFMAAEWKKIDVWPVEALINHQITQNFRNTASRMGDPLFCFTISQATTQFLDFQDNLHSLKVSPTLLVDDSIEGERHYAEKIALTANKSFNILRYKLSSRHEIVGREIFFVCCMLCIFNNDIVIEE